MSVEVTLGDTVILAAYTEGYIATSEEHLPCPYEIGTREFDLWALGHIHRRMLGIAPALAVRGLHMDDRRSNEDDERMPPCL